MTLSLREQMNIAITASDSGASATIGGVANAASGLSNIVSSGSLKMFAYSQAFTQTGTAMRNFGLVVLGALGAAAKAAGTFDHAMALADTQAQLSQANFQKVSNAALDISSNYGIAATDIANSFYDLFSTTNDTAKQAISQEQVLAKAAVAGGVDMTTVTRGVVAVENAFGLSADKTNKVLNIQFQMLRNSGGTYQELVSAFGNVIGSAKQTDQSIQDVSAAISFLTLRGRTQAQASISVSRALDQLTTHAADVKKVLGVSLYDSGGSFRSLISIINDMGSAMDGLSTKARNQDLQKMFGAGSIQANRFFRTALPDYKSLNDLAGKFGNIDTAGQLQKAYQYILKNDPSHIFDVMTQTVKNAGIAIANTLAPAFKSAAGWITRVTNTFRGFDAGTQKTIGIATLLLGALSLVSGTVLLLAGGMTRMVSVFKLAGGAAEDATRLFLGAEASMAAVVLTITAVVATGVAIYKLVQLYHQASEWGTKWATSVKNGTLTLAQLKQQVDAANASMTYSLNPLHDVQVFYDHWTSTRAYADAVSQVDAAYKTLLAPLQQGDSFLRSWTDSMSSATEGSVKQKSAFIDLLSAADSFGAHLSLSQRSVIDAMTSTGDYKDASTQLGKYLSGQMNGALKSITAGMTASETATIKADLKSKDYLQTLKDIASFQQKSAADVAKYQATVAAAQHIGMAKWSPGTVVIASQAKQQAQMITAIANTTKLTDAQGASLATLSAKMEGYGVMLSSTAQKQFMAAASAGKYKAASSILQGQIQKVISSTIKYDSVSAQTAFFNSKQADTINALAKQYQGMGGVLSKHQSALIGAALAAGKDSKAINILTGLINKVPTDIHGSVNISTSAAQNSVNALRNQITTLLAIMSRAGIHPSGGLGGSTGGVSRGPDPGSSNKSPLNGSSTLTTPRRSDIHIHIEPRKANISPADVVNELVWAQRTRGW